jgi:hypothetical protein
VAVWHWRHLSALSIRQNRSSAFDLFLKALYEKMRERSIYRSISRSIFMVQSRGRRCATIAAQRFGNGFPQRRLIHMMTCLWLQEAALPV